MRREVVGSMSEWSGALKDLFRQIDDGSISLQEIRAFLEHRDPFVVMGDSLGQLVSRVKKLLSKRFDKEIEVDPLPSEFTEENLLAWEKYNLKPIFLPDEEISRNRKLKNWVRPPEEFYQWIKEKKIAADSAVLRRGWYLADFSVGVDYTDGTQVLPNDPLASIIAQLRDRKIGKYKETPPGSRFAIVPKDEWSIVIAALVDDELKITGTGYKEKRLERYVEFLAIGNLYDENRGEFKTWEWFADNFGDSDQLYGGHRDFGGLAYVHYYWSGRRHDHISGRPLVSFE